MGNMYKGFIMLIIVVSVSIFEISLRTALAGEPIPKPENFILKKLPIGMNLDNIRYYAKALPFNDAMKSAGKLFAFPVGSYDWDSGKMGQIPVDSNGWPLQLPYNVAGANQAVRFLVNCFYSGDYVILYDGIGTIEASFPSQMINGVLHVKMPGATSMANIWIDITSSTLGNHVRNIRIIPAAYLNNEASMPTFREDFLKGLRPFHVLRFQEIMDTNHILNQKEWTNRPKKTDISQGLVKGMAWEYVVELSNSLNADPWICVPHEASDDYITQLATLLKNTLSPQRKLYLEYSNELWNWGFAQALYVVNNAPGHPNSYVSAGLAAIGAAGVNHPRKDAYMMARTFRIFQQVWGDQSSRIVKVASSQTSWSGNSESILNYLFNTDGIGADALAGGGYFYFNPTDHATWNAMNPASVTPEMILQSARLYWASNVAQQTRDNAAVAKQYGVDYIVYEGGQHMQPYNQQVWDYNHAVYDAQIHPGIYNIYMDVFNVHMEPAVGCKMFVAFSYITEKKLQYGSWGHLDNMGQLINASAYKTVAPKFQALLDINSAK